MDFPRNEDIHSYNTRGALNYPLPTHRTTHFSKKPSYLGRKVLNSLPQNLKNLRGNELKRRLQDWLVERSVYTINEFYSITFTHHHSYKAIVPYATISSTQRGPKQMVPKHPPKPFPTMNTSGMIRKIIPELTSRDCE
ncbi:hypothetical protein J6590_028797 [Homalodisca vitripennis]|nr:hypothetical protein J6590_028797 [Homalodisca vitripennis]